MQRIAAVLLLAALILAWTASDYALYRCRYSGAVRTSCCCTEAQREGKTSSPDVLKASCCEVAHVSVTHSEAEVARARTAKIPPVPALDLAIQSDFASESPLPSRRAQPGLPRKDIGPPLILLKRSLLI